MSHIQDIQIIELAAGHVAPVQARDLQAHLDTCPECRLRYQEMVEVWDETGTWQVPSPQLGVVTRAAQNCGRRCSYPMRLLSRWRPLTTAAAILLASAMGHWAGLRYGGPPVPSVAEVVEPRAAESLYLDELIGQNSLSSAVLWESESDLEQEL